MDLRKEMRERLTHYSKKLEGKEDWMARRKAARMEEPKPKSKVSEAPAEQILKSIDAQEQEPQPEPAQAGAEAANVPDADLEDKIREQRLKMLEMEKLLAAAQAELVNKERRLESVESELVLEKGLRQEFEADCTAAEEKAEQCVEKVKEAERLTKEERRWRKDQIEWQRDREAMRQKKEQMQMKMDFLVEHGNTATQRAEAAEMEIAGVEERLSVAEAKAARLERELFEANAKILEAQQERLVAMRMAKKASAAVHVTTPQFKQFDRGKTNVCER